MRWVSDINLNGVHSHIEYNGKTYAIQHNGEAFVIAFSTSYVSTGEIYRALPEPPNFSTSGIRFLEYMLFKNGEHNFVNSERWD